MLKIILWGLGLWLFGYLLGFVFFALVPTEQLGWYIMPFGIAATCLVLWRWLKLDSLQNGVTTGVIWTVIAVIADYLLIVKLLQPPDGYYKLDIYLYYALTFLLPVVFAVLWHRVTRETST
jgi:hypothetical protein